MATSAGCPAPEELERLMLGKGQDDEVATLEEHLSQCRQCRSTVASLETQDVLVEAIRAQCGVTDEPEQDRVDGLVAELLEHDPASASGTAVSDWGRELSRIRSDDVRETCALLAPPESPEELGRLGHFRIAKLLGAGGMGLVFQAHDPTLDRHVALKLLRSSRCGSESARQRFLSEARAAAKIEHDHIVTIHHAGEDRGLPYLAMQWLQGETLAERLKREEPLPPDEVLRIAREITLGLAAAHERGLVHGDIKPSNVWLEASGDRVKLLDFGLARAVDDADSLNQGGVIAGTPGYMAPEQVRGHTADQRSDLFSLGCLLYHASTGRVPFQGADSRSTLTAVLDHLPAPPHKHNPGIARAFSDLVMRLLEKEPAARYESADEVLEALDEVAELAKRRGRRRTLWLLAGAAVLVVAATLMYPQDANEGFPATATASREWQAGVASVVITPQEPIWLYGNEEQDLHWEAREHDLYARALALKTADGEPFVIVTIDAATIDRDLTERVRQRVLATTGLAADSLILNVSSAHATPDISPEGKILRDLKQEEAARIAVYRDTLESRLAEVVRLALEQVEGARLSVSRTTADFARDTLDRRGDEQVDHEVPILRVTNPAGTVLAVLFGYACPNSSLALTHPCGDYASFARERIEAAFPGATALFLMGCGSDQVPFPRADIQDAERNGRLLADAVVKALEDVTTDVYGPLTVAYEEMALSLEEPDPDRLTVQRRSTARPNRRAVHVHKRFESKPHGREGIAWKQPLPIHVARFGDELLLIALGGDPGVEYALQLKQGSEVPVVWVAGYTDDVSAGFPSAGALRGMESESDSNAESVRRQVVQAVRRLRNQVRSRDVAQETGVSTVSAKMLAQ